MCRVFEEEDRGQCARRDSGEEGRMGMWGGQIFWVLAETVNLAARRFLTRPWLTDSHKNPELVQMLW